MAALTTTSIKLDETLKARLAKLAEARRRSAHWLMREAIEQFVEREEQAEAMRQSALNAWSDYQAKGVNAKTDEAYAWLAQLEARAPTGRTAHDRPPKWRG